MQNLKTIIPPDLRIHPDQLTVLIDEKIKWFETPEFLEKVQSNPLALFGTDLVTVVSHYTILVYVYQQSKATYGKDKSLERMIAKLREIFLTKCISFMCNPELCEIILFLILSVVECRYFEGKYSVTFILSFMEKTKKLYSQLLAEVKAASRNFTSTEAFRKQIGELLKLSTKSLDIFYDINHLRFGEEDIEDLQQSCIRLKKRIYQLFDRKPVSTPQLFAMSNQAQHLQPEKRLLEATDYFFDFDDTIYHLKDSVISDAVALLIRLAHCIGIRCHIITARNKDIDHANEWIHAYQETGQITYITRSPGTSVPQLIQQFGLSDIFNTENIIYCNFKLTDVNENGIPRVISINHHKHHKVGDFKVYCEKKEIKHDRAVIFDDNASVWPSGELDETVKHFVNNQHEHLSFFYKLTHSLTQVLLYNETININLRKSVAEEMVNLLSDHLPVLYQPACEKLNAFISKPEQVFSPC